MACEVKTFGTIQDFKKVQLFFGLTHDENWLNSVNVAFSPTGELIALGHGEKFVLLSSCCDNKKQLTTYSLNWCGELDDPNQIITAIHCIPIYGKAVSSGPEWTIVVLGLTSGMTVFYNECGFKLYSQSFHNVPVLTIKSYTPPRHSDSGSYLYIIYDECICVIRGSDIFPLLINLRHNFNRAFGLSPESSSSQQNVLVDTVQHHKFNFPLNKDTIINDAVVFGGYTQHTFDHIVEQCLTSSYHAKISETPAQSSLVLGIGANPCLGFYYAEEGYKTISMTEVAKDVIGMAYKNLMGTFFSRVKEPSLEELAAPTKETQMRSRCQFIDNKRDGFNIVISPGGELAASTDNIERILLIDPQRGTILRVWKGYRDAQIAFVPVKENILKSVQTHRRRHALFLIVYVPRKGLLEIWALQNGPKVAAFSVSKGGQLSYNIHGLMGVPPDSHVRAYKNCCFFLDPSDGSVKEVLIPFHFALSESNSKTSRDIHLLRRLKSLLNKSSGTENIEEISKLSLEFQTLEVQEQCLEILKKNKQLSPQIFREIISSFCAAITKSDDFSEEALHFQITLENYKHLTDFYISFTTASSFDADSVDQLELSDSDLVIINRLLELLENNQPAISNNSKNIYFGNCKKVTFQGECKSEGDFMDYLNIFTVDIADSIPLCRKKSSEFGYISRKIFSEFFKDSLNIEKLKNEAHLSKIPPEDLLILVLYFWVEKPFHHNNCEEVIDDMSRLSVIVRAICELDYDRVNDYAYNSISSWWQNVRELLLEIPNVLGVLVAIVCKTLASTMRKGYKEGSCDESSYTDDNDRWEEISHDEAQWCLLIGKLEDIAVLGAILENPLESQEPVMPQITFDKPDCSLKAIVSGGKGIVTDLTAQWLINSGIHPSKIVESNIIHYGKECHENKADDADSTKENDKNKVDEINKKEIDSSNESEETELQKKLDPVIEKIEILRLHFPFSLESGVLLSLMSWHYMVHWSKNLNAVEHLRAAITCLAEFKKEDWALKHGMCCMLWNSTLKHPLQATTKLMQKVGWLPKDKMCQQDIDMSSVFVPDFLELAVEFFEHFSTSLDHDQRELKFERSLADGQLPIQFLALQQHHAMKELLRIHYELFSVLHFIAFFQLKVSKPITTLFDAMSNKAFFADINKELEFVLPAPDIALQQVREQFLCQVITASMDLIREDLVQLYLIEHDQYMTKIYSLADSWKLSKSALKRQQIVDMYAHGYDAEAEDLLRDIVDDEHIGRLLLQIAGQRLNLYTHKSQSAYMTVASVGPQLLSYLDNLRESPSLMNSIQITASEVSDVDLDFLQKLVSHSFRNLPRNDSKHLPIAGQMFDACNLLQEEEEE